MLDFYRIGDIGWVLHADPDDASLSDPAVALEWGADLERKGRCSPEWAPVGDLGHALDFLQQLHHVDSGSHS
jgi:hypothetical protein